MINKKQYTALSFFLTRMTFLGGGFSLLINTSKNNLLITAFLGMLLGYFLLYLFYKKGSINKYCLIIFAISTLLISILANTTLTTTYLLYNTSTIAIMLALIVVLGYGAAKEFKVTSRVGQVVFPIAFVITILASLALIYLVKIGNLFPLFNTNFKDFILGIIAFTGASLLPNLLIINYKGDLKFRDISKGYILGSITVLIIMFFILTIYGYEFASIVRYPEYLILKKIDISTFISNIENVLVMEWIANIIIGSIVCAKIIKDNSNIYFFVASIVVIFIGIELLLNNRYENILFIKNNYYYFNFALIFLGLIIGIGKKNKSN